MASMICFLDNPKNTHNQTNFHRKHNRLWCILRGIFLVGTFDPLLGQAILIYYFINFDLYVFHMIILM
jgi:hypothetical protein